MIFIYGRTTITSAHENSAQLLGSNAPCPVSNCRGVCRLYWLSPYCHYCFIPIFPSGPAREVVKCSMCRGHFQLDNYQQWRQRREQQNTNPINAVVNQLVGSDPRKKPLEVAKDWIELGRFDKVEFVLRNALKTDPANINLMCYLDVALNGLGKTQEADKLVSTIVYHWETHHRAKWIAAGRPEGGAAYPRLILKQGLPEGRIEAKHYFEPQQLGDTGILAFYKIVVYPAEEETKKAPTSHKMRRGGPGSYSSVSTKAVDDKRLFKLVKTPDGSFVVKAYSEDDTSNGKDAIVYDPEEKEQPDIRKVASDLVCFLAGGRRQMRNISGQPEVLSDGNATFQSFDPCEKDPRLSRVQAFVANSDWMAVRDFIATLQQDDEKDFWIRKVSREIEKTWSKTRLDGSMSTMLDRWLEAEPNSEICRVMRLETYVGWAWNARTSQVAGAISAQRFYEFHKRLTEAGKEYTGAKEICSGNPLLYSVGMTIARGLGANNPMVTMAECRAGLRDLSSDPLHFTAHVGALQYYCRKWGRSHEEMFEYARSITAQLPDGHPLWVLIPMAHRERVLIQGPDGYWQFPEVRKELLEAYQRTFPAGIASPVTTAPHKLSPEWVCRNYFAYCMIMTQQYEEARHQIRVIGKRPLENLWPDYKYYLVMLGFDVRAGETAAFGEGADQESELPIAQAEVVSSAEPPIAQAMFLPEVV